MAVAMVILRLLLAVTFLGSVKAIPIENGVEGDAEVECGASSITVNFNTQNAFNGHVYVQGQYNTPECRSDEGGRQVAGITVMFDQCGTARTRSLDPKGVYVTTTIVIIFHPKFITKVDRAFRIQCFYMEADKTVSTEIEVSGLTTGFQSQVVPMPICRYEILAGGPTGTPVQFALVGDQVYHKWTCDSETTETFCMVVHSCIVDDGATDTAELINADGCSNDRFLLNNLEYPTDLMAGQEAHVFKYADKTQVYFQCQITITIKEPNAECPRPTCPEPTGFATGAPPPAGLANPAAGGGGGASAAPGAGTGAGGAVRPSQPSGGGGAVPRPTGAIRPLTPAAGGASGGPAAARTTPRSLSVTVAASVASAGGGGGGASEAPEDAETPTLLWRHRNRQRRQVSVPPWEKDNVGTVDVRTTVSTLDIDRMDEPLLRSELNSRLHQLALDAHRDCQPKDGVCVSNAGFTALLAAVVAFVTVVIIVVSYARPKAYSKDT